MDAVFLLTDFGDRDAYVGVMKAVMLGIAPELRIVDLCHSIEPQNVTSAAYVLLTAMPYLPHGSVVVGVVDPGVGTARHIVGIRFAHVTLLVPDNGLAAMVLDRYAAEEVVAIDWRRVRDTLPSATFHGRDIFAPAAALLASGQRRLRELGEPLSIDSLQRLELAPHRAADGSIEARVLHIDRFGNLITNVEAAACGIEPVGCWQCEVNGVVLPLVRTYGEVPEGEPLCYIGSSGFLEVAVRNGNAAARFGSCPVIRFLQVST